MAPDALAQVLRPLRDTFAGEDFKEVLVGLEIPDDAAVYKLSDDLALVVSLDFFTPIVDDPYAYGAIAAANSLSDVYAMGARPILALNIAAFPADLPLEMSIEILRGGAEKAREAGIAVAGGHTIRDDEPKYGLVVIGTLHPSAVHRKGGARPGDRLLLSKKLGTGVVTTGLKSDTATAAEIEAATTSMMRLNRAAADIARLHEARAVTDITGFGLVGHGSEMAAQSGVGLHIEVGRLPLLPGAERLARKGAFPDGARDNRDHFGIHTTVDPAIPEWSELLCFSPETSGGLLIAVPPERETAALETAAERRVDLFPIGEVVAGSGIRLDS